MEAASVAARAWTASHTWIEYEGIFVVRKISAGRANLVEFEVDGPGHAQGTDDRRIQKWVRRVLSSGRISNDKMILVRNVWTDITANSCRFEQACSDDGGKTRETNWIALDTRVEK